MLIKPKFTNNITKAFLKEKIFCVTPNAGSDNFLFVLPFLSNKERFTRKIKKIQVICENNQTFKSHFNNIIFSKTSNFKKYDNSESSNAALNKDSRKNIFLEYGINEPVLRSSQVKTFAFSASNFEANHLSRIFNNFNSNTADNDIYLLSLGSSFSKKIEDIGTNQIRYLLFDEDNNIVESSDFFTIDFTEIKQNRLSIDKDAFLQEATKNFLKNMSFSLQREGDSNRYNLKVNFGSNLDEDLFERMSFVFSFIDTDNISHSLTVNKSIDQFNNTITTPIVRQTIPAKISKERILNIQNYKIEVKCSLFYKDSMPNSESDFMLISNQFDYDKQNSFILQCFEAGKNIAAMSLLNNISAQIKTSIVNRKIEFQVLFSNLSDVLKEKIKLKKIRKNSNTDIDFYYKNERFTVEERVFFQNENLKSLINQNNSLEFFISRFGSRTARFEIVLKLLDMEKIYSSEELFFQETYSNLIKEVNVKFKNNLLVNDPALQIGLNESKTNIISFNRMTLQNIQDFNDLALGFGYVNENNQGDIKNFLENCLVRVENFTKINGNLISIFKSKLFYLKSLFSTINNDSDFANIKKSNIENFIHTDDFLSLEKTKNQDSQEDREIIEFFISRDTDNAYKKILSINASVESQLKIKVLPVPFIIVDNIKNAEGLYTGLDSLGNININDNVLRQKLNLEVINYLYSGNSNLNWKKYNKFLKALFNPTEDDPGLSPINFYEELFSYLIERNTNNLCIYNKQTIFDNDSIFKQINVDQKYLETNMITKSYEENLLQNFFKLSYQNNEFKYLEFPFNVGFENINYFSQNNTVSFGSLKVINDTLNKDFILDITSLKTFYNNSSIRKITPKIRLSLHFLLTNNERDLREVNTEGTLFDVVVLGGKDYLTYNIDYMKSNSRFSSFNNFHNCLNNSLIKIKTDEEKVLLEIDKDSFSLNINNLNYNIYRGLFDFAKINNITILDKVILRTSIAFTIKNQLDENENITAFFNKELIKINLVDQDNVSINNLSNISSSIIT